VDQHPGIDRGGQAGAAGRTLAQRVTLNVFEPEPVVPLHHQVTTDLAMQLRLGPWAPGAIIPSEQELCAHYGVSRGTVRRALERLTRDGVIERHPGLGSKPKESSDSEVRITDIRARSALIRVRWNAMPVRRAACSTEIRWGSD